MVKARGKRSVSMEHFIQLYKLLRRLCKRSFVQVDKIPCARFAFLLRPSRHHTAAHRIIAADQFHRSKKKASYRTAAADRDSRPELHARPASPICPHTDGNKVIHRCFPEIGETEIVECLKGRRERQRGRGSVYRTKCGVIWCRKEKQEDEKNEQSL